LTPLVGVKGTGYLSVVLYGIGYSITTVIFFKTFEKCPKVMKKIPDTIQMIDSQICVLKCRC